MEDLALIKVGRRLANPTKMALFEAEADSLLELSQWNDLVQTIPAPVFTGGYLGVGVLVYGFGRIGEASSIMRIVAEISQVENCEVVNQDELAAVANLAESIVAIKETAVHAFNVQLLSDHGVFLRMGQAAQLAYQFLEVSEAVASEDFGDKVWNVIKLAVSCANSGLELLDRNIHNAARWERLVTRIMHIDFACEDLLQTPAILY